MFNSLNSILHWSISKGLLVFALLLLSCADDKHAGSSSVTTNGSLYGTVTDQKGNAVPNVTVYLQALTPNANAPVLAQKTDINGKYSFDTVPAGEYNVVVRSEDESLGALVYGVTIEAAKEVASPVLKLDSLVQLRIDLKSCVGNVGDEFKIYGTSFVTTISSQDSVLGYAQIDQLPKGEYAQIYLWSATAKIGVPLFKESFILNDTVELLMCDVENEDSIPMGFAQVERAENAVWGGAGGDTLTVSDTASLKAALDSDAPRVIFIKGRIQGAGLALRVGSNKTILGMGDDSGLDSLGLSIKRKSNIVIRNLRFNGGLEDAINIEDSSKYVWIDHNTFENYGDGLIDIKRVSNYVSISWNHFKNHSNTSVIGHSDNTGAQDSGYLKVTWYNNWFDSVEFAAPRVRYGQVHMFNNAFSNISGYAIASTQNAQVVVESNWFWNVKSPTIIAHTSPLKGDLIEFDNLYYSSGTPNVWGSAFDPKKLYAYSSISAQQVAIKVVSESGVGRLRSLR